MVVPNLMAVASVDGPDVVGRREIENAVYDERSGLDDAAANTKRPGKGERVDIGGVDLVESAVAAAGVVAVVAGPVVGWRLEKRGGIEALTGHADWKQP